MLNVVFSVRVCVIPISHSCCTPTHISHALSRLQLHEHDAHGAASSDADELVLQLVLHIDDALAHGCRARLVRGCGDEVSDDAWLVCCIVRPPDVFVSYSLLSYYHPAYFPHEYCSPHVFQFETSHIITFGEQGQR
jgi:hypothetical protein